MLSAVKRYKLKLSGALLRYFPRTAAYLRAEDGNLLRHGTGAAKPRSKSPANPKKKTANKARKAASAGPRKITEGIYGPAPLPISEQQIQAMRDQVRKAASAGVVSLPSDEQWAMILNTAPLTRVFAGAGSGKSSTLLLRLVFMLCHLQIKPEQLTVISFTSASCEQLRKQLLDLLSFWQYPFDQSQARQCVRTFHSAMGTLATALLGKPSWFEQLNDKTANPNELDNPLTASRLGAAQQRLLKQAYQACYDAEPEFRQQVHQLLSLPAPPTPADNAKTKPAGKAPQDTYKLKGEFSPAPLFEAFYAQINFIQSIGIHIAGLDPAKLQCSAQERLFMQALVAFNRYFETALKEQDLLTFNLAFEQLTELFNGNKGASASAALEPFQHLLIDEFQDISPQIVKWLQAVQRSLAKQKQAVSLMAIGDDWQSIYAWRGSSPELFMNFDKHFPSKGKSKKSSVLLMTTNYRSIDPIITAGEQVLKGVELKQNKTCQASRPTQPGEHGVKVVSRFDINRRLPELLEQISEQCSYAAEQSKPEKTAVLLLSRANHTLKAIQAQLDKKLPVKGYTIHRAKGLQAQVAIIVDDCKAPDSYPLRNALYAYSGYFVNSYDQAMRDESLRLGYVAITRGVSRVFWYTQKVQGATQLLAARG
ncbi:DEAD/DEAH box helicase [Pseudomonas segetis]|uniref:UvrD/REP helicase N-terminal domain-containing protein n=1 Tax=Pseudomonas segetis TaxID=298908 RepID=A0A238ZGR7_9PSED|nr:DEAD/DEAH box helicase [Pseudomonas segetis]SNR82676.1 UvrD/REP helicase N-terminal domain-containing protein [Pseudomonas segetis]